MGIFVRIIQGLLLIGALTAAVVAVVFGFDAVHDTKQACQTQPPDYRISSSCALAPRYQVAATTYVGLGIGGLTCAISAAALNGWVRRSTAPAPATPTHSAPAGYPARPPY